MIQINTDALIAEQRGKLADFVRESERMIDTMNDNIRASVSRNLEGIAKGQLGEFSRVLNTLITQIVQDAMANAVKSAEASQGGFSLSSLQSGADLLKALEKAKRNL